MMEYSVEYCQDFPHNTIMDLNNLYHDLRRMNVSASISYLNQTPISERWAFWCGSKSGNQKELCLGEIEQGIQNLSVIPGSIINIIVCLWVGGTYLNVLCLHLFLDFYKIVTTIYEIMVFLWIITWILDDIRVFKKKRPNTLNLN